MRVVLKKRVCHGRNIVKKLSPNLGFASRTTIRCRLVRWRASESLTYDTTEERSSRWLPLDRFAGRTLVQYQTVNFAKNTVPATSRLAFQILPEVAVPPGRCGLRFPAIRNQARGCAS